MMDLFLVFSFIKKKFHGTISLGKVYNPELTEQ